MFHSSANNILVIAFVASILTACGGGGGGGGGGDIVMPTSNPNPIFNGEISQPDIVTPNTVSTQFDSGLASDAFLLIKSFDLIGDIEFLSLNARTGAFNQLVIETPNNLDDGISFALPEIVGNEVLATGRDNSLNAFDLTTGRFVWDRPIGNYGFGWDISSTVCEDQICYTRGAHGVISAINANTRNVIWETDVSNDPSEDDDLEGSDPVLYNGRVYVATHQDSSLSIRPFSAPTLHVLDAGTGALLGEIAIPTNLKPPGFRDRVVFPFQPVIFGNILLFSGGDLVAYNADTLTPAWTAGLQGASIPVFAGGLFVTHTLFGGRPVEQQSQTVGIDPQTGEMRWALPANTADLYMPPASDGQTVFTLMGGCNGNTCRLSPAAIDGATGQLLWHNTRLHIPGLHTPLIAGNALYFDFMETDSISEWGDGLGMLSKLDGSLQWTNRRADDHGVAVLKSGDATFRHHARINN